MEGKGMKHIYIHCPLLPSSDYRLTLERLCGDTVRDITVHTYFAQTPDARDIEALVETQKAFGLERLTRFRNYAVFTALPRLSRSLCKALRKHSFTLDLQAERSWAPKLVSIAKKLEKSAIAYRITLDEQDDQPGAYRVFAELGLHIHFTDPQYTAQSPAQFDRWLYAPKAQGINTYCDIINMLVLQTHSPNCRHASCFGTTFRVDEELKVYLCPFHIEQRTLLGSLREAENLNALLDSPVVAQVLMDAVEKRQRCSGSCEAFPLCQGGCPLESEPREGCREYGITAQHIRQRLLEVYREGKLEQVNYIVKNAILNALAFGTAFFNQ